LRQPHESEVVNAFRRLLQALRQASVQTQAETGISAAQLFVLSQLQNAPSLSINELARLTMTDRSSVADVVERLTERKLVRRSPSLQDRRRADVRLTAAGRALLRKAPPAPTALLLGGLAHLSLAEVRTLAAGMKRLCEELGLTDEQPEMLFEASSARTQR
jgi:DNA-binding MarR family transcriptional regulator